MTDTSNGTIRLGSLAIAESEATQHIAFAGSTGSGKTTALRLLMQDVLPGIGSVPDRRALTFDPKGDMLPIISGMAPNAVVHSLDPFSIQGISWDICKDVTEPCVALGMAEILFPKVHESQPFFSDSARHLNYGTMLSFMERELEWSLADLIRAFASPRLLKRVLYASPASRTIVSRYFQDRKVLSNILSTAATKMLAFEPIAASWEAASSKIAISDWVTSNSILVLGNSEVSRFAIDAINRCIFKRTVDLSLDLPNSNTRRTWFLIDELSDQPKLDGILPLAKKGRSKGCCMAIAYQSVAGLRDAQLYGPSGAAELLGQIGHRFFGRLECPETAAYASTLFGEQLVRQITINRTYSRENSVCHNESYTTRPAVLPSELMSIAPCGIENGLTAFYLSRAVPGVFQSTIKGDLLFNGALAPIDERVSRLRRDVKTQYLLPWSSEQEDYFAPPIIKSKAGVRKTGNSTPQESLNSDLLDL